MLRSVLFFLLTTFICNAVIDQISIFFKETSPQQMLTQAKKNIPTQVFPTKKIVSVRNTIKSWLGTNMNVSPKISKKKLNKRKISKALHKVSNRFGFDSKPKIYDVVANIPTKSFKPRKSGKHYVFSSSEIYFPDFRKLRKEKERFQQVTEKGDHYISAKC